jgi:hypothetical protein
MSGSIEVSFSLRLVSVSNLLLYLVLTTAREEKPFSHKYQVANRMRKRTALSESAGYSLRRCTHKSRNVWPLKADFNVSSQDDFAPFLLPLLIVTAVSQCRSKIIAYDGYMQKTNVTVTSTSKYCFKKSFILRGVPLEGARVPLVRVTQ